MNRTFAFGDLHGDLPALETVMAKLPRLDGGDTLVFVGDYLDRGRDSKGTVAFVRGLPSRIPARVVTLMGNHEDGWLRVMNGGWPEFVWPAGNGCIATVRSFLGTQPTEDGRPQREEMEALFDGRFLPPDVVEWMKEDLLYYYEDAHAIYVHAGLPFQDGEFVHPSRLPDPKPLLWERSEKFFLEYRGKRVVCGHTQTSTLPQELSTYTPADPTDLFAHRSVMAIDTGAGKDDGFLTAVELPSCQVYESRR